MERDFAGNCTADKGCTFVLTKRGYDRTLEQIKPERTVGKPVPGFAEKVPASWVEKGYFEERRGEA